MSSVHRRDTRTTNQLPATIGYYLAFITLGLVAAVTGPTLPALAERVHVHLDEISIVFATRSAGYLVGSLLGGHTYDRVPGHPVIALMLAVIATMMLLVPVIPVLWILATVLFIVGLAESAVDVGCNSLLIWLHRHAVGPWMNGLHFCFGVGAFIAPIVIAQVVLATGDITWAYWTLALLIVPGVLWLPRLASPLPQEVPHIQRTSATHWGIVFLLACFIFLYVGAEAAFGGWVFAYATNLHLADATMAAYLVAVFWGALTVGRFLGIPIAARLAPRVILVLDLIACLLAIGMIIVWSDSAAILWIGAIATGLGMASIYPAMLAFAGQQMTITGQITGWVSLGAGAGGMFLPWVIGQLFVVVGPHVTMLVLFADVTAGLALMLVILLYALHQRRK